MTDDTEITTPDADSDAAQIAADEKLWDELASSADAGESAPAPVVEQDPVEPLAAPAVTATTDTPKLDPDPGEEEADPKSDPVPTMDERIAALESSRDDYKHRYESDRGRVSALQKQIDGMTKAPLDESSDDNENEDLKAWNNYAEEFPDEAKGIQAYLTSELGKRTPASPSAAPSSPAPQPADAEKFSLQMDAVFDDRWRNLADDQKFWDFANKQDGAMQALESLDFAGTKKLVNSFFDQQQKSEKAADVQRQRNQRQADSRETVGRSSGSRTEMNAEELWAAEAAKADKEMGLNALRGI